MSELDQIAEAVPVPCSECGTKNLVHVITEAYTHCTGAHCARCNRYTPHNWASPQAARDAAARARPRGDA